MIPNILIRTVPESTADVVEGYWRRWCELHPTWTHVTYRDPIDPDLFPVSSPYWHRCNKGAQLAGLIRLEALLNHGGHYLDSDMEPYRSLHSLSPLHAYAAHEDAGVVPDAVIGAEAGHPAIAECLSLAIERLDGGPWWSGPGVTTAVFPGRDDVLLLPPGSWFPAHYTVKNDVDWAQVQAENPWAFGAHRWYASWLP